MKTQLTNDMSIGGLLASVRLIPQEILLWSPGRGDRQQHWEGAIAHAVGL